MSDWAATFTLLKFIFFRDLSCRLKLSKQFVCYWLVVYPPPIGYTHLNLFYIRVSFAKLLSSY